MSSQPKILSQPQAEFIPFARPNIGEEERALVNSCLDSGWLTSGPQVKKFEENFAKYIGSGVEAVAINSATSGLMLSLEAVGVGQGDEVITTPYTFSASAMVAVHLGATPVFVDIDPVTMNIDPARIEAAITPRTKAIVPVHFAGMPCDMDRIIAIARKHNLRIVEDAAHAPPTYWKGTQIGALDTDATVFSFYATKNITTGEGGMIVTKNTEIAKRCRVMRLHGISSDVFDRYTSTKPKWFYQIVAPGYKCNMTDINASIGIPQLAKSKEFHQRRSAIAERYRDAFADLPITLPSEAADDGSVHSYHLFVIRLHDNAPVTRDAFINTMSETYSIGCSVHFIPLHMHPYWQESLGVTNESFPIATDSHLRAVSLPLYTKLTDAEVDRIIAAVQSILAR